MEGSVVPKQAETPPVPPAPAPAPPARAKLGLALAGGGFRASLFHLGVLRRMAELDLLRSVEVLSTVSGGSIIGGLYTLLLRRALNQKKVLDQGGYGSLIDELQRVLIAAIQKDLRTRLAMNPFGILRVLLSRQSLGERMARIYDRYIFKQVLDASDGRSRLARLFRPGRILLRDVRFKPGGGGLPHGIEAYNRDAVQSGGSAVPTLILNATSLNSGEPFRLSSVEVGDPVLGFFRSDETEHLKNLKPLMDDVALTELEAALKGAKGTEATIRGSPFPMRTVSLARWLRDEEASGPASIPQGWEDLFQQPDFPGELREADFGPLRKAKLAAWYLQRGPQHVPPVDGGVPREAHFARLWEAIRLIDEKVALSLRGCEKTNPPLRETFLEFVLTLYYLRSAEVASPRLEKDWQLLTFGEAVGASACFPPVFPPFLILGFYDDLWVTRLGLTDGGVYDNTGVDTLLEEGCTHIIASDTGGLFDVERRVAGGRLGMLARIVGILQEAIGDTQRHLLRERRRLARDLEGVAGKVSEAAQIKTRYGLQGLAYFHIISPPVGEASLDTGLDREELASIRTDLDAFGDIEIAALVNQGYATADCYLRTHLGTSVYAARGTWAPASRAPLPLPEDPNRIRRALTAARWRTFRAVRLGAPVSVLFCIAAVSAIVLGTWKNRFYFSEPLSSAPARFLSWVGRGVIWGPLGSFGEISLGTAFLVVAAAMFVWKVGWPWLFKATKRFWPRGARRLAFFVKWLRSGVGNLSWLWHWSPVFIALLVSGLAWGSYLFFKLPYLSATRIRKPGR